jgi:hypothetical protein
MSLYKLDDGLDEEDKLFLGVKDKQPPATGDFYSSIPITTSIPTLTLRSANDKSKQQARMAPRKVKKLNRIATIEEGLDEDFLSTPWRVPSIQAAKDYKFSEVYRGGEGNMAEVDVTAAAELGVGVRMYFQFVKSIGVALLIMSILSVPLIFFALKGKGIAVEDQDPLSLYKFSLGNIGNPNVKFSANDYTLNTTIAKFNGYNITYGEANFLITICELLQIIVFLMVIMHLRRKLYQFNHQELTKNTVSITNYAIYVENLPEDDFTEEDLIKHFSDLYPLDKPDWKKRHPVEDARPVQNCDNTGNPAYINTWVSECIIHRAVGDLILKYKQSEDLLKDLFRIRAKMKMYSHDTTHINGADMKRFLKSEEKMLGLAEKMDHFNYFSRTYFHEKILKVKEMEKKRRVEEKQKQEKLKAKKSKNKKGGNKDKELEKKKKQEAEEEEEKNKKATNFEVDLEQGLKTSQEQNQILDADGLLSSNPGGTTDNSADLSALLTQSDSSYIFPPHMGSLASPRYLYAKKAPVVGAFITFEYNEGFARCLEDYQRYSSFPYSSLFYPEQLKFKGRKLKVTKALEPDQIIWENLEIKPIRSMYLRYRTYFLTFVIIFVCFVVILVISNARLSYASQIPTNHLCTVTIPELYLPESSYSRNDYESYLTSTVGWTRPKPLEQEAYDMNCSRFIEHSIYAVYAENGDFRTPVNNYSFDACVFEPYSQNNLLFKDRSLRPTELPTVSPTAFPSVFPSSYPTSSPTITLQPTNTVRRRNLINNDNVLVHDNQPYDHNYNYSYCPQVRQPMYCPCMSIKQPIDLSRTQGGLAQQTANNKQQCSSLYTQLSQLNPKNLTSEELTFLSNQNKQLQDGDSTVGLETFSEKTMGYCYCKQMLSDSRTFTDSLSHLMQTIQFWKKPSDSEKILQQSQIERDHSFCQEFNQLMIFSYAVTFASILIIVLVNSLLRRVLLSLTGYERHSSVDHEQASIFKKLFFSTYINTSIIILIAYGISVNFATLSVGQGKYVDFIRAWYGNNGFSLVTTVFLTMIEPLAGKYFYNSFYVPIRRYRAHQQIQKKTVHSTVMQYDLNKLEVGPTFLPTITMAELLTVLFIMMTFTTGLPLLTPIAFFGFFFYFRLDKYYLGNYYRKPPVLDDRMISLVIKYLPYAVVIRCVFAIWMLSNSSILPGNFPTHYFLFHLPNLEGTIKKTSNGFVNLASFDMGQYKNFLNGLDSTYQKMVPKYLLFIYHRIMRMNTFPIFVLLVIVILTLLVQYIWDFLPIQRISEWYYRRSLMSKKKATIFSTAIAKGHVHPFDLLLTCLDPLRQEAAPFTGIYYQFLTRNKAQIEDELNGKKKSLLYKIFCCCGLCISCWSFLCPCCRDKKEFSEEKNSNAFNEVDLDDDDDDLDDDLENNKPKGDVNELESDQRTWLNCCKNFFTGKCLSKKDLTCSSVCSVLGKRLLPSQTASSKNRRKYLKRYEKLDGWEITDMGFDFEVKVKVWTGRTADGGRPQSPDVHENTRMKGQHKKTFEVISDNRCNTYHMCGIPNYILIFNFLYAQEIDPNGFIVGIPTNNNINNNNNNPTTPSHINPFVALSQKLSSKPQQAQSPKKIQSLVDYYITNWKEQNAHKFFNPQKIENDLVKFDLKMKEKKLHKKSKKNAILPVSDDSADEDDNSLSVSNNALKLKRANSHRSIGSNGEDLLNDRDESKNSVDDPEKKEIVVKSAEKKKKNKEESNNKKKTSRTFVIDENEEEEEESDEESDEEDDSEEDGSEESSTEESETDSSEEDDDSEEEEESESESEESEDVEGMEKVAEGNEKDDLESV